MIDWNRPDTWPDDLEGVTLGRDGLLRALRALAAHLDRYPGDHALVRLHLRAALLASWRDDADMAAAYAAVVRRLRA